MIQKIERDIALRINRLREIRTTNWKRGLFMKKRPKKKTLYIE